jgi:hypothetical protein
MKIVVDNKLTYECSYPVKVGDIVVVPAPWFLRDNGSTTTGKVTKIGSDYDGYVLNIISVNK